MIVIQVGTGSRGITYRYNIVCTVRYKMLLQSDNTCLHPVPLYDDILLPSVDNFGPTCTARDVVYVRSREGLTTM